LNVAKDGEARMDLQPVIARARREIGEIMARDAIPGAAAALVQGGEAVWTEAFGQTRAEGGRPIDPHTLFSLQSTSKNITAVAVMIAVQRGLLDLDAPITRYLPAFTVPSRHEAAPQEKITLRLLLSHRAGFTHEAPVGGNWEAEVSAYESFSFEAHAESISRTWLRYPVGRRYAYSNLGIDLAAFILGQACGTSFADALKALVFDPLGMAVTSCDPDVYAANANRAIGHQPGMPAVPVRVPMQAAGGVCSNVVDMARFAAFHLGRGTLDGVEILRRELWEEMHRLSFGGYPYALGVALRPVYVGSGPVTRYGHNGGGFGFGSCFYYCPDHQLAWIVLFNGQTTAGPPAPFDNVALRPALEAALGKSAPRAAPTDPVVKPDAADLAPFAGSYIAGFSRLSVRQDDHGLALRAPGEAEYSRLAFVAPDRAYLAEGPSAPHGVQFHPAAGLEAARLVFDSGLEFDLNDGPDDPPGTIGDAYNALLGDYAVIQWGVSALAAPLHKKNGYLYLGSMRLTEHSPGLLFTADGEAVDLRGPFPTLANIVLHRAG
jgi:CubicO group peptidase (beta-lactamase class C family)